jgi:hypothetical protein
VVSKFENLALFRLTNNFRSAAHLSFLCQSKVSFQDIDMVPTASSSSVALFLGGGGWLVVFDDGWFVANSGFHCRSFVVFVSLYSRCFSLFVVFCHLLLCSQLFASFGFVLAVDHFVLWLVAHMVALTSRDLFCFFFRSACCFVFVFLCLIREWVDTLVAS